MKAAQAGERCMHRWLISGKQRLWCVSGTASEVPAQCGNPRPSSATRSQLHDLQWKRRVDSQATVVVIRHDMAFKPAFRKPTAKRQRSPFRSAELLDLREYDRARVGGGRHD